MNLNKSQNKQLAVVAQSVDQVAGPYVFDTGVGEVTIVTDSQYVQCAEDLRLLKTKQKEVKALRDSFVEGAKKTIENVDAVFKPQLNLIAELEKELKRALSQYVNDLRKLAMEKMAEATASNNQEALMRATEIEQPKVDGIQLRVGYKVIIENEEEIPREYLKIDEAKIKKAAKAGVRVHGVKVIEYTTIAAGSK